MSVRETNEKISTKLEEIKTLSIVKKKLETIRNQALERLTLESSVHAIEELKEILQFIDKGYSSRTGQWSSNVNSPPKEWASINYLGINQIDGKVKFLNDQVEILKQQLPSTLKVDSAKARVTELAMERRALQQEKLSIIEETAPVIMSMVDILITQFLPVLDEQLSPLDERLSSVKAQEQSVQGKISDILQEFDLVRSYGFTVPVKPVTVPQELVTLIELARKLIPLLAVGNKSALDEYNRIAVKTFDLTVA